MYHKSDKKRAFRKGVALIICMVFLVIFTALAVGMAGMSDANVQLANNQHCADQAFTAAESGIECGKYYLTHVTGLPSTGSNTISPSEATTCWNTLCTYIRSLNPGGVTVSAATGFTDSCGSGSQLVVPSITLDPNAHQTFQLRFYRYTSGLNDPNVICIESTGYQGGAKKKVTIGAKMQKQNTIMHYAIASRARVWITGNSTIFGPIYSSWKYQGLSPFNMTSDSKVRGFYDDDGTYVAGTINTILKNINPSTHKPGSTLYAGSSSLSYHLETLAATSISGSDNLVAGEPEYTVTSQSIYNATGSLLADYISGLSLSGSPGKPIYDTFGNPVYGSNGHVLYDISGNPLYDAVRRTDSDGGQAIYTQLLDSSGNPIPGSYIPLYQVQGNKVISSSDQIQGLCDGINYGTDEYGNPLPDSATVPGMQLSDYSSVESTYKPQTQLPSSDSTVYNYNYYHGNPTTPQTVTEYFPHAVDSHGNPLYGQASSSGSLKITRYVCQGKTLNNFQVGTNKNALFQNCTFNGILYVDNKNSQNSVRFENCTFNGPIVTYPSTDTSSGWWQRNQLYFTGTESFQTPDEYHTTILAPNFNVNLGNTDPTEHDNNVLTGAIVGGIVDVRGNAQVSGTIISMFDTSSYSSGYVSNIGATTDDGGSETVMIGDVGTITIQPRRDSMLPSGIITPIVIKPQSTSYSETN